MFDPHLLFLVSSVKKEYVREGNLTVTLTSTLTFHAVHGIKLTGCDNRTLHSKIFANIGPFMRQKYNFFVLCGMLRTRFD